MLATAIAIEGVDAGEAFAAIVAAEWPLFSRLVVGCLHADRSTPWAGAPRNERLTCYSWVPGTPGPRGRSPPKKLKIESSSRTYWR